MAKSILKKLFDGEIYPSENIKPDTPEYNEAKKALAEEKEYFLNRLSGDDLDRFAKMDDLYYDISDIYGYECFTHGFTIGTLFIVEVMSAKNHIYNNVKKPAYNHRFELTALQVNGKVSQRIVHKQKNSTYRKEYKFSVQTPVEMTVYIIGFNNDWLMLLPP